MTWYQRHWLEDFKTFPKCPRTCEKLKNWASYALRKLGNFWEFWKVNIDANDPKMLMGPFFLPSFFMPSLCTTIRPKGKYFLIFYLFIWIFIHINSIKSIKYVKILPFGPSGRAYAWNDESWKKNGPICNFRSFGSKLTFPNIQKFPNFYKA